VDSKISGFNPAICSNDKRYKNMCASNNNYINFLLYENNDDSYKLLSSSEMRRSFLW
jgi:hypothetical protein